MASQSLGCLVRQVEALVADPSAEQAPTGDAALDRALADLRIACETEQPLPSQMLGFWAG